MMAARRLFLRALPVGGVVAASALSGIGAAWLAPALAATTVKKRKIPVQVKKFVFQPERIEIKAGETVILQLSAVDFTHGFNLPDFHLRRDLIPGQVVNVELNITEPGTYDFLCDNFCGNGHEEMNGKLVVL